MACIGICFGGCIYTQKKNVDLVVWHVLVCGRGSCLVELCRCSIPIWILCILILFITESQVLRYQHDSPCVNFSFLFRLCFSKSSFQVGVCSVLQRLLSELTLHCHKTVLNITDQLPSLSWASAAANAAALISFRLIFPSWIISQNYIFNWLSLYVFIQLILEFCFCN